jgi:hypothetical protein
MSRVDDELREHTPCDEECRDPNKACTMCAVFAAARMMLDSHREIANRQDLCEVCHCRPSCGGHAKHCPVAIDGDERYSIGEPVEIRCDDHAMTLLMGYFATNVVIPEHVAENMRRALKFIDDELQMLKRQPRRAAH